jgi:hypothetical protein
MLEKVWRYMVVRLLLQNGYNASHVKYSDGEDILNFILKKKKKETDLKEVHNG